MVVIKTSNYGQDLFLDPSLSFEEAKERVLDRIYRDPDHFSPEFLNRTTILVADFLQPDVIVQVVTREVRKQQAKYQKRNPNLSVQFDDESAVRLVENTFDKKYGARKPKDMIKDNIGGELARIVLEQRSQKGEASGNLTVDYDGNFNFTFEG